MRQYLRYPQHPLRSLLSQGVTMPDLTERFPNPEACRQHIKQIVAYAETGFGGMFPSKKDREAQVERQRELRKTALGKLDTAERAALGINLEEGEA